MQKYVDSLNLVYSKKSSWFITLVASLLIGWVFFRFTYFALMVGNLGIAYAWVQTVLQLLIAFLFGVNMAVLGFKLNMAGTVKKQQSAATAFGGILSVIVSGCPACGITLASYLGVATIFTTLPLYGMELKVAGFLLILYSTASLLKDVGTCKREEIKKPA